MNDIEYRLRDAFRADADTISPQDVRPLSGAEPLPSRGHIRRGRVARFAVPLVAAAAVAAVVVAVTLIPKPSGEPFASGPAPRFFVMVGGLPLGPHGRPQLASVNTSTGRVADTLLRLPNHGNAIAVAAYRSPGQFVVEAAPRASCATSFYQFRLTNAGQFADVHQLGIEFADVAYGSLELAASTTKPIIVSSGTRCEPPGHNGVMISDVHVINLGTGKITTWTLREKSDGIGPYDLAVSADGRVAGLVSNLGLKAKQGRRFGPPEYGWAIPTSSPSGPLAKYWHRVVGNRPHPTGIALNPDGTVMSAAVVVNLPHSDYYSLLFNQYQNATGRRLASRKLFGHLIAEASTKLDRSGRYLLVQRLSGSEKLLRAEILDLATGRTRYIPGYVASGAEGIAW